MNKHFSHAKTEGVTGIDAAIYKYGRENFSVEIIDTCEPEQLDELERFYIAKYDSYNNGYNLTKGGQDGKGSKLDIDVDYAYDIYLQEKSIKRAAKILGCSDTTLSNIFKEAGKECDKFQLEIGMQNLQVGAELIKQPVKINELNKEFDSIVDCARWLIDNGYTVAKVNTVRNCIRRVCTGERMTYLKMTYQFLEK